MIYKLFFFFLLFAGPPSGLQAQTLKDSQILELYTEAQNFFQTASDLISKNPEQAQNYFKKSAMRYEKIIREGNIHNGKLYYNLGNIYFRMKDSGRTILNYRRAMNYIPNDPNLKLNLKYARSKRKDKVEEPQKAIILKTLFFMHYDLNVYTRIILFTVFFTGIWIFACIRIFSKHSFLNWLLSLCIMFSVLFATSLIVEEISIHNHKEGVILDGSVIARKGNSHTYEKSFLAPLHSGTEFVLLEQRGDWCFIQLFDNRTCWILKKSAELFT